MPMSYQFEVEKSFKTFLAGLNHPFPPEKEMTFNSINFMRYRCPHSSISNLDVSYRAFLDGTPTILIKCNRCHNQMFKHSFSGFQKMPTDEWKKLQVENAKRKAEQENKREAALKAMCAEWDHAKPCRNHAYFTKKQVSIAESDGLRINNLGRILCPVRLITGELISTQAIPFKGKKKFYTGVSSKNGFHVLGSIEAHDTIFFGEGIATCLTVKEALGMSVVCVYGKHFDSIAPIIAKAYPNKKFIYCCDLPSQGENFTSQESAKKAIFLIGGSFCIPDFSVIANDFRSDIPRSDFNDLFMLLITRGLNREAALLEIRQQVLNKNTQDIEMITNQTKDINNKSSSNEIIPTSQINEQDPVPLPNSLPEVMPFNSDEMLPLCIRDYITDVAERQQCPIDFVAVAAICGLAGLLGRKALMCPKQNDDKWRVVPNLWGAIIGRPSTMKSPSMNAALEPMREIESEAAKQHETAKKKYEINKEFAELNKTTAKDNAKKQIKEGKNKEAKETLEAAIFIDPPPTRKRLIVNDASVEKLGELLNQNPNGLILIRDELSGWLAKLAMEEHQMERAFYLECFEGSGTYICDRIGRGTVDIKSTTVSIVGGIQPSRISPLIRDAIKGTADDGLVQRLQLAVWPDNLEDWDWIDCEPNKEAKDRYFNAFKNLHNLSFEVKTEEPPCFRFNEEAQKSFIVWMKEIQKIARTDNIHPALESYLLKLPKTVAALALLFQILNNNNLEKSESGTVLLIGEDKLLVDKEPTAQALKWADYLKSHAERIYSIATHQGLEGARLILKRIDKLENEFTARDIQRKGWTGLSEIRTIEEALDWLIDYKHISSQEIPPTNRGGRSTVRYFKNKKYTNGVKN